MTVSPPTSIDRSGIRDAAADLTEWVKTVPDGSEIAMGTGATYLLDTTWALTEKRDLKINWQSSMIRRTSLAADAGVMFDLIGCSDIEWFGGRFTGSNAAMEAGARTPRESHHIGRSSGSKDVCIYACEFDHPWGDCFYYGWRDVGGPRQTAYIWSENVWVTGCYLHHAGRQIVTAQGVRGCVLADNDMEQANRSGIDAEGYSFPAGTPDAGIEKNGIDGFTIERNRIGANRLNWLANEGTGQSDNVTIRGNLFARTPTILGTVSRGKRRRGWVIDGNRLMAPGESRHIVAPPVGQPPHSGSTGAGLFTLTGYDDATITSNGPFFVDRGRGMSLALLKDCQRPHVTGNLIEEVRGGDSARQWEQTGPGVELRTA